MNSSQLAQLKEQLNQYPENSKPQHPIGERRQLVSILFDEIETLRQKHYSFRDISGLLESTTSLLIKPNTLRKYFFEERTKRQGQALKHTIPNRSRLGKTRSAAAQTQASGKTPAPKTRSAKQAKTA